jgi:hypothetical protein
MTVARQAAARYLVRYGTVPEVARFVSELSLTRGDTVVVRSPRGLQLGTVLERERSLESTMTDDVPAIERRAEPADLAMAARLQRACETEYPEWCRRISEWQLAVELLDLEWTLDGRKQILYVLTERGPDATRLALQAAAAGLGPIEVQPVQHEGPVPVAGHGCGSGGCGCRHEPMSQHPAPPALHRGASDDSP